MEKQSKTLIQALFALILILGTSMGMVYWVTASSYNNKIETLRTDYSKTFSDLTKEATESKASMIEIDETRFWCNDCHDAVEEFHNPKSITILAFAKDRERRVCVNCHGFSVHPIHKNKLDTGQIECQTCHDLEGQFIKPRVKPGDILVCQQCHWKGNFIDIHITHGKATCLNCHVGGVQNVHKRTDMNAQKDLINQVPLDEVDLSVIEIVP